MAINISLDLEGIDGESRKDPEKIDIDSWSWGSTQSGAPRGQSQVHFRELVLVKKVDVATPVLAHFCWTGKKIRRGILRAWKVGGLGARIETGAKGRANPNDDSLNYISLLMNDVMVAAISAGGQDASDQFVETITLSYSRFWYGYYEQSDKGQGQKWVDFGWDIPGHQPLPPRSPSQYRTLEKPRASEVGSR